MGGGRGHLTRSLRLAQVFSKLHWLIPERLAPFHPHLDACRLLPPQKREPLALAVQAELDRYQPDLLVVDTFPRGVLGELAQVQWSCPAWLISRWVEPAYAARAEVQEALLRYFCLSVELAPWPCQADVGVVVPPPVLAREENQVLCLIKPPAWLPYWCEQRGLECLGPFPQDAPGRTCQRLAQACLVLCAGGYNSYYEVVQSGVPALFVPEPRAFDDQRLRCLGRLGPAPRSWHRVLESLDDLDTALQEWWELRPSVAPSLALGRPQWIEGLVQQHVFGTDHVAAPTGRLQV